MQIKNEVVERGILKMTGMMKQEERMMVRKIDLKTASPMARNQNWESK